MLYQAWPDSVKQVDSQDRHSLATIVRVGGSRTIVEFLHEAYSEAASAKDNQGMLPIYHAVRFGLLDTVTALVADWPDSLKERDTAGEIPLFLALTRHEFNEGIVKLLLEAWPGRSSDP